MDLFFKSDPTDRVTHNGKTNSIVAKGDSQTSVNDKLAAEVEDLKKQIAELKSQSDTSKGLPSDKVAVSANFGDSDKMTEYTERFKMSVEPTGGSINVAYDLSTLIPTGFRLVSSEVKIDGKRNGLSTVLVDTDKYINSFMLNPDNFPASLSVNLKVTDDSSINRNIVAKMPLNSAGESGMYIASVRELNNSNLKTQSDINDFMYNKVTNLNKKIVDKVTLGGVEMNIQEAFTYILNTINKSK